MGVGQGQGIVGGSRWSGGGGGGDPSWAPGAVWTTVVVAVVP